MSNLFVEDTWGIVETDLKGYKDLGKGILYIDINNNNNGNCDTKYVNIDMIEGNDELKERVKRNDKIY